MVEVKKDHPSRLPLIMIGGIEQFNQETADATPLLPPRRRPLFAEGSLKASIFNLTNATLGAGIISVPYAISQLGLIPGLLAIIALSICSTTATKLLVTALDHTSAASFEHLAELAGGRTFTILVQIVMVLFNFGAA